MKNCLLLTGILCLSICLTAQHETSPEFESSEHETTHDDQDHKYKIAIAPGYSLIPAGFDDAGGNESVFAPSIGLDFFYSLNHKFSLGVVADLELANYLVNFDRESLQRERALILALIGTYEVLPQWALLVGGGIELERHKNLGVVRLGTEYEIELGKEWSLGPSLFFDIKEAFSVWAFSVAIGKRF